MRTLYVYNCVSKSPRMFRYALVHAGTVFGMLAMLPPASELSPAALAVVAGGSFAAAYSVMAVG